MKTVSDHTISTKGAKEKKSKDDVFACPNYDIRSHSQMQIPIHSQKTKNATVSQSTDYASSLRPAPASDSLIFALSKPHA